MRLPQPLDLNFCPQHRQVRIAGTSAAGRPDSAGGPFLRGLWRLFFRSVIIIV